MKTATVELEAGGVGCHGRFVDLDWFFVLVVELRVGEAAVFLFERRKCPGTGARRGAPGHVAPVPGRAGAHRGGNRA